MKRVSFYKKRKGKSQARDNVLHIETEHCIVNITVGLTDTLGRSVTAIEIIPDKYAGEPAITVDGPRHVRVIQEKE
jgi:hypothetical protein